MADALEIVALASAIKAEKVAPAAAEAWLEEHVDPETGYVLDDSLTIAGAAADAKAAGDAIEGVKAALASAYDTTATYKFGQYCYHNGKLYVAVADIDIAEAWTETHWAETTVAEELEAIKQITAPQTWGEIQALVRTGKINRFLSVGNQLTVEIGNAAYDFDTLGINEDCPVAENLTNCLSIQMHKVFLQKVFDPTQYLFAVTAAACTAFGWPSSGMPAGKYKVTLNHGGYNDSTNQDATYVFTTTQIVPPGGGVRHGVMGENNKAKADVLAGKFTTYGADTTTTIETDIACTEYDAETDTDAVDLGTASGHSPSYKSGDYINFTERQRYGSNRWSTSWIRQYLNSDKATMTWTPKTIWSRNISGEMPEGFLHTLDPELKAVIGKVRKRYALSVADGAGYEDIEDFVNLMTYTDLTGSKNNNVYEGPVDASGNVTRTGKYTFWKSRTSNADRIKYEGSTARYWWLASASPSNGSNVWSVYPSGTVFGSYAYNSYGVVPSLFII